MMALGSILVLAFQAAPGTAQALRTERAPEWDALFDRHSGWTGADGIYSIPLAGDEHSGGLSAQHTLFVFSDTFVGKVDAAGRRQAGSTLVNNTIALLAAGGPDPDRIRFWYPRDAQNRPGAVFTPSTPGAMPGEWYWLKDGVALGSTTWVFAERFESPGPGRFRSVGLALLELPPGSAPPFADHLQHEVPLWLPPSGPHGNLAFGAAILANTATAGAPRPDGYVYVYGVRDDSPVKKLMAARVPEASFIDPAAWTFYDGAAWVADIHAAAPLCGRVSNELSVSPLPDGRFVLAFELDGVGRDVVVRIGDTPVGPFGPITTVWTAPEPGWLDGVYTYNAKAHPHLSRPGELLISYNVNTVEFADHFRYADIYRPRFVRVTF